MKKAMFAITVVVVGLVLSSLACTDNDIKNVKDDYANNVIATQVPVIGNMQDAAEKANQAAEKMVVEPIARNVNDAKTSVQTSTTGQAVDALSTSPVGCTKGVLSLGCDGK